VNVSRGGLLVPCQEAHAWGMSLWVTFPYDATVAYGQPEVLAKVVRSVSAERVVGVGANGAGHVAAIPRGVALTSAPEIMIGGKTLPESAALHTVNGNHAMMAALRFEIAPRRHSNGNGHKREIERRMATRQPVAVPESAAEKRKAQWSAGRERLWMVSVYATSFLFIVLITAEFIYAKGTSTLSAATAVSLVDGAVSIPLAQVADGDLHRYAVSEGGTQIRFLLFQKPDGKVAVVFDACEICGGAGFFKTANGLVCKNCASPINSQSVGTVGGCNPVPLKSSISGGDIVIQEADLGAGARLFKR